MGMMGDLPSRLLASRIGAGTDITSIWLTWTMSAMLLYGVYLLATQRPDRPVNPTQLL